MQFVRSLTQKLKHPHAPGTVIAHSPATSGLYIGSPSITITEAGLLLTSHDFFGPNSDEHHAPQTYIYASKDNGTSWKLVSKIKGAFWSKLFWHDDCLWLLGTDRHHGNLVIRKSTDFGKTWTEPTDRKNGLLADGEFHCAPTPFVQHEGFLWKAFEQKIANETEWPKYYSPLILSISTDDNLLDAANWRISNTLLYNPDLLEGKFGGWLEGNVVHTPQNTLANLLRVENDYTHTEHLAFCDINTQSNLLTPNKSHAFVQFPGGSKKFMIRLDTVSKKYIALTNTIKETNDTKDVEPDNLRNQLSLVSSTDLLTWKIEQEILYHPDHTKNGFQYVSWVIKDKDILFVSRTATDDRSGGANSFHNANYLTFHIIKDFRTLL